MLNYSRRIETERPAHLLSYRKNRPGESDIHLAGDATIGSLGVIKSASVDVLPTSSTRDSSLHLAVMPSSASTDDVEKLRSAIRSTSRNDIDSGSPTNDQSLLSAAASSGAYHRRLTSSSSADIEASHRLSPVRSGRKPRRPFRRSMDAAETLPSPPFVATSVDYRLPSHDIWHSPTSAVAGASAAATSASGNRLVSGALDNAAATSNGSPTSGAYSSQHRTRLNPIANRLRQSAVARRLAADGQRDDDSDAEWTAVHQEDSPLRRVAPSVGERGDPHSGRHRGRLTNGIVSRSTVPPSNGRDIIDRLSSDRLSDLLMDLPDDTSRLPRRSVGELLRTHSSLQPSTSASRKSSTAAAVTKRRRRTIELPCHDPRNRQTAPLVLDASNVSEVDRVSLLDRITKEELFELWQSSERALNEQLRAAFEQRSELQRKLQQALSTERLTVT